jgi:hypothetical protein
MAKIFVLLALVSVAGCKLLPNFPIVFMSHQDLLDQAREIDSSFKGEKN